MTGRSRDTPVPRRAARVLCVDPAGAVLLVGGSDPARPDDPTVWLPPGGGLELSDPDPAVAARRELFEETGLWLDDVGQVVATRQVEFGFAGERFSQQEDWYAVRTPAFEPVPAGWSEWERQSLRGLRWWLPSEPLDGVVPQDVPRLASHVHRSLPPEPVRPTVRVLVVDREDRCLLMEGPTASGGRVWFPPGGGLEPGETPEDAARRELSEEIGLDVADLGPCVWLRRHVISGELDLRERWHLLRVDTHEPDVAGWTELERRVVTDLRWWTMDEMADTDELLAPRDLGLRLPGLLADHAAGRLPAHPPEVGL